MPRGPKCRRVCEVPENRGFEPQTPSGGEVKILVEELEAIRLCDREGLEQDEAARRMNISRPTFQRILYEARRKIADALCEGKAIEIGGGCYELTGKNCGCRKPCRNCRFEKNP